VSLCRRPINQKDTAITTTTRSRDTKDIVELLSFGSMGSNNKEYVADTASHSYDNDDNEEDKLQKQDQNKKIGELSFVCISHAGEVFVYDPIKLLLGIEEENLDEDDTDREAKHELEKVSSFFFGQELFQNLQQNWKPLAEPSSRIHLSVFEHDIQQEVDLDPFSNLLKSNEELSGWATSVLGVSSSDNHEKVNKKKKKHPRRGSASSGGGGSVNCGGGGSGSGSISFCGSGGGGSISFCGSGGSSSGASIINNNIIMSL